jgi:hypothetical protein
MMFAWKKDAPSDWTPLSELSAERRMSGQRYPKGIGEGKRVRKWTQFSFLRSPEGARWPLAIPRKAPGGR